MRPAQIVGVIAGLFFAALPAHAQIFAVAQSRDGARVLLHTGAGPCVGAARLAEHVSAEGEKTPGCWLMMQGTILVSFLDGERGDIPVAHLKRVADL